MLLIMNVVFFIPIGYLVKNKGFLRSFVIVLVSVLGIESTQYVLALGFFDAGDIVLNLVGIYLGYFYFRRQD